MAEDDGLMGGRIGRFGSVERPRILEFKPQIHNLVHATAHGRSDRTPVGVRHSYRVRRARVHA
jgi:hypothetical protein